ncbi:unnamed protein product [Musa acuminata subsp. malaccensis]|uniref:(wild Malaysian banana) hypothetical protein n=1 Tax=Musa acuminata subsp. malaccensis TaxID=214687 RepID=A0A804IZ40_MUSAM|nr:unnamed protein product [Musa acuminata subsp. malaccensis]
MATEDERSRRWPLSRRRRPSTISSSVHLLWWTVDQMRIFHDKPIAVGMLSELGFNGPALSEDLIIEVCRCGGAELYPFAVGSRENNLSYRTEHSFDGIDQMSQVSVIQLLASRKGGILLMNTDDRV